MRRSPAAHRKDDCGRKQRSIACLETALDLEYRDLPPSNDRFIVAGINRMRPIAMTTFAAILALSPLALGIGQGSAMQQPLAIAIISGLLFGLPLVLIVLPTLLSLFGARRETG